MIGLLAFLVRLWYAPFHDHSVFTDMSLLGASNTSAVVGENLLNFPYEWLQLLFVFWWRHVHQCCQCPRFWDHPIPWYDFPKKECRCIWKNTCLCWLSGQLFCIFLIPCLLFHYDLCLAYWILQSIYHQQCQTHWIAHWTTHLSSSGTCHWRALPQIVILHICICQIEKGK